MKAKTPKVQVDIWEAKEKLYEVVKNLSPDEQIKKLLSSGKSFPDEIRRLKEEKKIAH